MIDADAPQPDPMWDGLVATLRNAGVASTRIRPESRFERRNHCLARVATRPIRPLHGDEVQATRRRDEQVDAGGGG